MFLPVMRGTLSLPAMRDPEVLERLQPTHVYNLCSRLQVNLALIFKINHYQSIESFAVTLQFVRDQSRTGSNDY